MSTIFNKIIKKEIPAKIIYEDDDVLAFLDLSQNTKGHTLVIPKEETKSLLTASPDIVSKVFVVAQKIAKDLVDIFEADGVNLLTNAGEIAGQSVFHFHVHVIPRYSISELQFKTTENDIEIDVVYETILQYYK
ncbi:MAG: HIT family protein [Erysipelothrix sp.]|nr:HIT family protein [Erysipelothrix sp.]